MNSPCVNCGADLRVCKECDWYNGVWISKDQYKVRLKADMVAMLTEIQTEIEENVLADDPSTLLSFLKARETCVAVIQQKIHALKPEIEDKV